MTKTLASMFSWLFGIPRFRCYEDSYARSREGMLAGVRDALQNRMEKGEKFLIVTHFADAFSEIQDKLADWGFDYQINSAKLNASAAKQLVLDSNSQIVLSLSGLLQFEATSDSFDSENKICVMVLEMHPGGKLDDELQQFCRSIPCHIEMGYFLSFEDAVLSPLVGDSTLKILDMFGMGENELVTSNMVSRRLKYALKHNAWYYTTDHPADSAAEWMQVNKRP